MLLSIGEAELDRVRQARAVARERAWQHGAAPGRVILDFDATPITIHSEKEHAAGHYKGAFGFNPLLATCGREVLAGILRPGNAGANNAADHLSVLDLALEQLPQSALDGEILARSDSAGASHDLASPAASAASGFPLDTRSMSESERRSSRSQRPHGRPAAGQDGEPREGAWVAELTGHVNLDLLAVRHPADLPPRASPPRGAALLH